MANFSKLRNKGKPLQSQLQEAICLLHSHFQAERRSGVMIGNRQQPRLLVSTVLKVGKNQVSNCLRKKKVNSPFRTPKMNLHRVKKVTGIDGFAKEVITKIILRNHFHGKHITIDSLLIEVRQSGEFNGSRSSLHRILKSLGFKWRKADNRIVLMEKPDIILKRLAFLREYNQNMKSPQPYTVVYLDETWLFLNGSDVKTWTRPNDPLSVPKRPAGEGKRFIVLHAGTKYGFVPGCSLLFSSRAQTMDYHGEMNSEMFNKWVDTQLIPGLKEMNKGPYLIVMDNASYHSKQVDKQPTSSWRKDEYIAWLQSHNIHVPDNALRKEVMNLALMHRSSLKRYEVDIKLEQHGHKVLRLPPYHCQYNPIELVWGEAKAYYNKHINDSARFPEGMNKTEKTKILWQEALDKVAPATWENDIRHAEELIIQDWEKEISFERAQEHVLPMIINLQDYDSTDEEELIDDPDDDFDGSVPQANNSTAVVDDIYIPASQDSEREPSQDAIADVDMVPDDDNKPDDNNHIADVDDNAMPDDDNKPDHNNFLYYDNYLDYEIPEPDGDADDTVIDFSRIPGDIDSDMTNSFPSLAAQSFSTPSRATIPSTKCNPLDGSLPSIDQSISSCKNQTIDLVIPSTFTSPIQSTIRTTRCYVGSRKNRKKPPDTT